MAESARSEVRPARVLIVDDEPTLVEILTEHLRTLPGAPLVESARDGQEALDSIQRARPDLVMLDINMPVMNGLDALRHIRALDPALPVLMITGSDSHSASQALAAGAIGYLPKPMDLRYVTHLVEMALSARPARPAVAAAIAAPAPPPPARPAAAPAATSSFFRPPSAPAPAR